jgi:hypothetical protein
LADFALEQKDSAVTSTRGKMAPKTKFKMAPDHVFKMASERKSPMLAVTFKMVSEQKWRTLAENTSKMTVGYRNKVIEQMQNAAWNKMEAG